MLQFRKFKNDILQNLFFLLIFFKRRLFSLIFQFSLERLLSWKSTELPKMLKFPKIPDTVNAGCLTATLATLDIWQSSYHCSKRLTAVKQFCCQFFDIALLPFVKFVCLSIPVPSFHIILFSTYWIWKPRSLTYLFFPEFHQSKSQKTHGFSGYLEFENIYKFVPILLNYFHFIYSYMVYRLLVCECDFFCKL